MTRAVAAAVTFSGACKKMREREKERAFLFSLESGQWSGERSSVRNAGERVALAWPSAREVEERGRRRGRRRHHGHHGLWSGGGGGGGGRRRRRRRRGGAEGEGENLGFKYFAL